MKCKTSFLYTVFVLSLCGCKLTLPVGEGGNVDSLSTTRDCTSGSTCVFDVADTTFNEDFTAVPDSGWRFVRWSDGTDFLCTNSTDPVCNVNNTLVSGLPAAEAIVASDKSYYLMPVFEAIPQPITDTLMADGKEWAQVDLFLGLSWNAVTGTCPAGACSGTLNGYEVDGWTWASAAEVAAMMSSYGIVPPLQENESIAEVDSVWAPAFFAAGWRSTSVPCLGEKLEGWTRDESFFSPGDANRATLRDCTIVADAASTNDFESKNFPDLITGVWLYR